MVDDYYRDVTKVLRDAGCHFVRSGKGSHEIWYSPLTRRSCHRAPREEKPYRQRGPEGCGSAEGVLSTGSQRWSS